MPTVIPPGFAEVAIELRGAGDPEPWYVTFGVDLPATEVSPEGVGLAIMQSFGPVMGSMGTYVTNTGVYLTIGQDGPSNIRTFVPSLVVRPGLTPGAKLPQNCALLVRKNSNFGGRRNRGRMFIPGILAEGAVNEVGLIAADALNEYVTAVQAFFDNLTSIGQVPMSMVILHSNLGSQPVPDPTPVASVSCDNVIATQRRRLR